MITGVEVKGEHCQRNNGSLSLWRPRSSCVGALPDYQPTPLRRPAPRRHLVTTAVFSAPNADAAAFFAVARQSF